MPWIAHHIGDDREAGGLCRAIRHKTLLCLRTKPKDLLGLPQAPHLAGLKKGKKFTVRGVKAVPVICRGAPVW